MTTVMPAAGSTAERPAEPDPRRWKALGVLGVIQFMLILDTTVVNVALPRIQHDLGFSRPGLAWVVNGYVLMAGGLLLLGGRLADVLGRRRVFLFGVALFALASASCGAAMAPSMLVSSRFIQGIGEALASPAAVGIIAVIFTDPRERMKALGLWGGIAGLGGVCGTIISGALTDLASWRWVFFINVPVALVALLMVPRLVSESRMVREGRRLDFAGAIIATGGLVAIVYGLLEASSHPWGAWQVLLPLLGGIGLLGIMVLVESRSKSPVIPLRFFTNRTRVVANVVTLFLSSAFYSFFFLMTLFEQQLLRYSPLQGGLSYVPFGVGIGIGVGLSASLSPRLGVKPVMAVGYFGAAGGMFTTSFIQVGTSYVGGVLPGMIMLGVFSGMCFPAIGNAALHQVTGQDSGLASGVQNAMTQVGGAIGLACLVTFALRHAAGDLLHGVPYPFAATNGYVLAFRIGAALLAVGGVLVLLLMEQITAQPRNRQAVPAPDAALAGADGRD
jgi:EmrB/QacA subfamily drug resistance transporter